MYSSARLTQGERGRIGVESKAAVVETGLKGLVSGNPSACTGHYQLPLTFGTSAIDPPVPGPFVAEEQKPSTQPGKRLNPQKTDKLTRIVSAPPQIPQIAADTAIRYDGSWYLDDSLDIDEPAIACPDLAGGVEKTDMSCVVKIRD